MTKFKAVVQNVKTEEHEERIMVDGLTSNSTTLFNHAMCSK